MTEIPQHMNDNDLSFIDDLLPWAARAQKECPGKFKSLNLSRYNLKLKIYLKPC